MEDKKRKKILGVATVIFIVLVSGRCFSIFSNPNIRTVDLLSILALGVLIGIFVGLLMDQRNKSK